jgi:hypothetical protein
MMSVMHALGVACYSLLFELRMHRFRALQHAVEDIQI